MKRAGVIGYPLRHSLSPAIFQTAFEASGVEGTYEAWETTPEQLEGRINALRGDEMLGANVTIPHKEAVVPLLDRLDERAERVGAVNTIVHDRGDLAGYNTAAAGLAPALRLSEHHRRPRRGPGTARNRRPPSSVAGSTDVRSQRCRMALVLGRQNRCPAYAP